MITMEKGLIFAITVSILLTLSLPTSGPAGQHNKGITPYGDFCERVSHYGMHKRMLSNEEVKEALTHYFGEKGLKFELVENSGRFVKAIIKDSNKVVDTIILDRHTGRIRSVN